MNREKSTQHGSHSMCKGPETKTSLASSRKGSGPGRLRCGEWWGMRLERQAGDPHAAWRPREGLSPILMQQAGFWQDSDRKEEVPSPTALSRCLRTQYICTVCYRSSLPSQVSLCHSSKCGLHDKNCKLPEGQKPGLLPLLLAQKS